MSLNIEVILTPAEFPALTSRDLSTTTCVVFDVLRATSSMLTALDNGAEAIIPVGEIAEALALRRARPEVLLAGERNGLRIRKELTGGVDFDFGNSPRDFAPEKVRDRTIAWTTTNGTGALRACARAELVLLGALVNLGALTEVLNQLRPKNLVLVCAGTFESAAFEDQFAAGALIDLLRAGVRDLALSDAAQLVWRASRQITDDGALVASSLNARRLLSNPDLAPDVSICLKRDSVSLNAAMGSGGTVKPLPGFGSMLA
jgi:2-phosphosulfolactate phosphatase